MDTTKRYTKAYRDRVASFPNAITTFREDILKTSSDLYAQGKLPNLVKPLDRTSFVGVFGNRDTHALAVGLVTHNKEYGFESCQANLVRASGLVLPKGNSEAYVAMKAKIEEGDFKGIAQYLQLLDNANLLQRGKLADGRCQWYNGAMGMNLKTSTLIPCSYYIRADNRIVILPKFDSRGSTNAGYSPVSQRADLFGFDVIGEGGENNQKRIQLEQVLAETWINLKAKAVDPIADLLNTILAKEKIK